MSSELVMTVRGRTRRHRAISSTVEPASRITVWPGSTSRDAAAPMRALDSAWSPERSKSNAKVERQLRRLNDGTTFEIYKRYCNQDDISRWAREYDVNLRIEHFGAAFYAVSGAFSGL